MTTSQTNSFLSEVLSASVIPAGKLAYFRGRLTNRFHALVLEEFARLESEGVMTRADLARRIAREPAQITRWLGTPGNWTLDTISDLLIGMGYEPGLSLVNLRQANEQFASTTPQLPSEQEATRPGQETFAQALAPVAAGKDLPEMRAGNDEIYQHVFGLRAVQQTIAA